MNDFIDISILSLHGSQYANIVRQMEVFKKSNFENYPNYLSDTISTRIAPKKSYPWAKSLLIFTIPFSTIPDVSLDIKTTTDDSKAGIVAGYAIKQDYHFYGKSILENYCKRLGEDIKYKICIDTAQIAEKQFAHFANLGSFGKNHLLLCQKEDSSAFLAYLFIDKDLPETKNVPKEYCSNCMKCIKNCPSQALSTKSFNYKKCISALTMEMRKELTLSEQKLLGNNLFGCSHCSSACKNSNLLSDIKVDLEWLLLSPAGVVKRAISKTAMNYAGVTMLRRNALYILKNKKSYELINEFTNSTNSEFLKNLLVP